MQRYYAITHPGETLLTWVKTGEIAIAEIQHPLAWKATQVHNLLGSLYQSFPVGYIIAWRNLTVKRKDGSLSDGKRVLTDGQQRATALVALLPGSKLLNKDYKTVRIRMATKIRAYLERL